MKMSLQWHEECLKNFARTLAEKTASLARMESEVQNMQTRWLVYDYQVKEAKRQGKDGFDRDKFCQPRKPKGT